MYQKTKAVHPFRVNMNAQMVDGLKSSAHTNSTTSRHKPGTEEEEMTDRWERWDFMTSSCHRIVFSPSRWWGWGLRFRVLRSGCLFFVFWKPFHYSFCRPTDSLSLSQSRTHHGVMKNLCISVVALRSDVNVCWPWPRGVTLKCDTFWWVMVCLFYYKL